MEAKLVAPFNDRLLALLERIAVALEFQAEDNFHTSHAISVQDWDAAVLTCIENIRRWAHEGPGRLSMTIALEHELQRLLKSEANQ